MAQSLIIRASVQMFSPPAGIYQGVGVVANVMAVKHSRISVETRSKGTLPSTLGRYGTGSSVTESIGEKNSTTESRAEKYIIKQTGEQYHLD